MRATGCRARAGATPAGGRCCRWPSGPAAGTTAYLVPPCLPVFRTRVRDVERGLLVPDRVVRLSAASGRLVHVAVPRERLKVELAPGDARGRCIFGCIGAREAAEHLAGLVSENTHALSLIHSVTR